MQGEKSHIQDVSPARPFGTLCFQPYESLLTYLWKPATHNCLNILPWFKSRSAHLQCKCLPQTLPSSRKRGDIRDSTPASIPVSWTNIWITFLPPALPRADRWTRETFWASAGILLLICNKLSCLCNKYFFWAKYQLNFLCKWRAMGYTQSLSLQLLCFLQRYWLSSPSLAKTSLHTPN